jgi:hypothetical protein
VAEHCKGSERYGHLNDDRAEREQPDFSLGLRIHGSPNAQRHGSFQGVADLARLVQIFRRDEIGTRSFLLAGKSLIVARGYRRCSITLVGILWRLGIPVQHYVEAIGGTANIARLGYIVEKIGTTERILPHAVAQRFEVSSSGTLVAPTEGSTKPTTVTVTNAGIATVEQ